jgi:hypothetical protein
VTPRPAAGGRRHCLPCRTGLGAVPGHRHPAWTRALTSLLVDQLHGGEVDLALQLLGLHREQPPEEAGDIVYHGLDQAGRAGPDPFTPFTPHKHPAGRLHM